MRCKELRRLRNSKGWTLHFLSKKIGISSVYLSQIENGRRNLSYKNAVLISNCFQMKPDDIFYNDFLRGE